MQTIIDENNVKLSEYIAKKEFAAHPENPLSEPELNWVFKQRELNGFSKAFVKFSARGFLVHIPSFLDCLKEKSGA